MLLNGTKGFRKIKSWIARMLWVVLTPLHTHSFGWLKIFSSVK